MEVVTAYNKGISVNDLSKKYCLPRSTIYYWIQTTIVNSESINTKTTSQDFTRLTQRLAKSNSIIEIMKSTVISNLSSTKDRVLEIKRLTFEGYSVNESCEAINLAKSTYYRLVNTTEELNSYEKRAIEYTEIIEETCFEHNYSIGADKIAHIMKSKGYPTSQKYVSRLMREANIENSRNNSKNYYKRLNSMAKKDLVQMKFTSDAPNKIWASDITDLRFNDSTYKLCIIMDLYSRKIIAYKLSLTASTHLLTSCFRSALKCRKIIDEIIFHSDRGSQYVSFAFKKLLDQNKFKQSFSKARNPYNNSVVESFFASFKREEFHRVKLESVRSLYKCVDDYMTRYNEHRPHATNNYLTPNEKERLYYDEAF